MSRVLYNFITLASFFLHLRSNHGILKVRPTSLALDIRLISQRHEFYETDEKLTISIFDRGADPAQVSIAFEPRKVSNLTHPGRQNPQRSYRLAMQMARRHYP